MRSPKPLLGPLLASLSLLAQPLPSRADWMPVLPGTVVRVVASQRLVAAIREGQVLVLREDGTLLRHLATTTTAGTKPDRARSARSADRQEGEQLFDLLDMPEIDRDTDFAHDLAEDDSTLAQRRNTRRSPAPPPIAVSGIPYLAADAEDLWISDHHGVLHVRPDGTVVRQFGRPWHDVRLSASAGRLLVARGDTLAVLSTLDGSAHFLDRGSATRHLAISETGAGLAWSTESALLWTRSSAETNCIEPATSIVDLTYCGETLVALLADGVVIVPPGGQPEIHKQELRARRLVCLQAPATPWFALGDQLLISADQGRHWAALPAPAGVALYDLASSDHHLWLATSAGLYASIATDEEGALPTGNVVETRKDRSGRRLAKWFAWLPKVSVRAVARFGPNDRQVEALALAAFPLDPKATPAPGPARSGGLGAPAIVPPPAPAPLPASARDPDAACLAETRHRAVALVMSEPERARSYVTRAGRAAWLPEIRVLVSRRYGRSESLDIDSGSTSLSSPLGIDTVNDIRYEARATWDLARLVFSPEELAAQTQALHMAELRRDIETTINRLYFERRGLMLDGTATAGAIRRQLRIAEIAAELDAISGGSFTACTAATSRAGR